MKPIISGNCRIRHPEYFSVGEHSIVDDYSYFSTKVRIGRCSHIAACCTVAGGKKMSFTLGNYCSVSSGVRIWCASDDFVNDIVTIVPEGSGGIKDHLITGDVSIADMCAVGSNAVIMPGNSIPEGTVIGALSFVPPGFKFKSWSVYAGIPVKRIGSRNRKNVLRQAALLERRMRERKLK